MKRPIHLLFIIFTSFFIGPGCGKQFLDVPDPTTALRQAYVTDLASTADFLDGIYIVLAKDFFHGFNQVYPDLVADNLKLYSAGSTTLYAPYNWVQEQGENTANVNSSKNRNATWMTGYQLIRSCSFVIEKAEAYRDDDPIKADDFKAQALAIRALVHFTLTNTFAQPYGFTSNANHAGVPYITTYDWTEPVTQRNTVAEDYEAMIEDLEQAIPLFNPESNSTLYMNQSAAKALQARIALFKGDYSLAKKWAVELSAEHPLMPAASTGYPSKLYTLNETEAFFQLAPSAAGRTLTSPNGSYTGTYSTIFQGVYFGSGFFYATTDIARLLTENPDDLRQSWVNLSVSGAGDSTWKITKFPADLIPGFSSAYKTGSYYATLLRSSEMVLTASEAYAQLQNEDSALYYLNAIRSRANIPVLTAVTTGSDLLDSIYLERRREMAFEGLRIFDLQRWGKGVHRQDALGSAVKDLPYPNNQAIAPLPRQDVNSGLIQNPGY